MTVKYSFGEGPHLIIFTLPQKKQDNNYIGRSGSVIADKNLKLFVNFHYDIIKSNATFLKLFFPSFKKLFYFIYVKYTVIY